MWCNPPEVLHACTAVSTVTKPGQVIHRAAACHRFFLPPIIFSAGLQVRKKSFFRNFVSIASLGILGTYVALTTIVVVLLIYRKAFGFLTMQVSLTIGSTLSVTVSQVVHNVQLRNKQLCTPSAEPDDIRLFHWTGKLERCLRQFVQLMSNSATDPLNLETIIDIVCVRFYQCIVLGRCILN